jgi:glycosyltransferase involved in cell wall biosynthesis
VISAVIATKDRATRLEALLHSLVSQRGAGALEAIVVDDGSRDLTPDLLERGIDGMEVRALRHDPPRGPAAARNAGWRAARGELVAFLDDDVVAEEGWAGALLAAHRRAPGAVIQGRTDPDPAELEAAGVFRRSRAVTGPDPGYPACNIAYPRALLERLGGFYEGFRRPSGEDTDLAWRARAAGAEVIYEDSARVRHAVYAGGLTGLVRDAARWEDTVLALKRNPAMRSAYHHRVFWQESHELLLVAVMGACLTRRTRGLSLALIAPYALHYASHHRRRAGALAALPGYALVDAAEMLALLRGSARHRTFIV